MATAASYLSTDVTHPVADRTLDTVPGTNTTPLSNHDNFRRKAQLHTIDSINISGHLNSTQDNRRSVTHDRPVGSDVSDRDDFVDRKTCEASQIIQPFTGQGFRLGASTNSEMYNCRFTKIFKGNESFTGYHCEDNLQSSQTLTSKVEDGALLCVLSDPVVCYKDAYFNQKQTFNMSSHGNLVYLDWLIGGRVALEELWQFTSYQNLTDVFMDGSLVYRDNYKLHNDGVVNVRDTMTSCQQLGSCILLGDRLGAAIKNLTEKLGRKKDIGESHDPALTCSVSPLCYTVNQTTVKGTYIRFMASSSKKAYNGVISYIVEELREMLGGNPFEDKY